MGMTTPTVGSVDENARRQFEEAWRQGRPQPIEQFLPAYNHPDYLATLEELVHLELELLWKSRGEHSTLTAAADRTPCVEDYLARFALLRRPKVVVRLLQQEYRVRHCYGDRPSTSEYCTRFPEIVNTGREVEGSLGAGTAAGRQADGCGFRSPATRWLGFSAGAVWASSTGAMTPT